MALGMKQWLGIVAIGVFCVGIATVPPKTLEVPTRRNAPLQAERRLNALRADAIRTANRLQRLRWADRVIPATLSGRGPVVIGFHDNTIPAQTERVRARILGDLEADPAPTEVALGVFFQDPSDALYPGAPDRNRLETLYYFGERGGRAYCAAVHQTWRLSRDGTARISAMAPEGSYLGVCDLIRKYGLPGPAVGRWLAHGGTALAASGRANGGGDVLFYRDVRNGVSRRRGLLGRRSNVYGWLLSRVEYDQCFSGLAAGCAALFVTPFTPGWRGSPDPSAALDFPQAPAQATQSSSIFEPADYGTVATLAQEFGRERFLTWWQAEGNVEDSFQEAFGVDVGRWNMKRIANFVTITRPGPTVSEGGLMGGVLLLALSSVVAGLWARRRRVA